MVGRIIRVVLGFGVACLAAGLTLVLFVYTPLELATETGSERALEVAVLALHAATHSAVFAAPFAFIAAVYGEWQNLGSWLYYCVVGIAIAAVGLFAQFQADGANSYAVTAFLVAGLVAGLVYWLLSGRFAAGGQGPTQEVILPQRPSTPPPGTPNSPSARAATH